MNTDYGGDKWLQLMAEVDEPSVPLAVPPHLVVTLRKHPEVSADQLVRMAGVIAGHLDRLDREIGGPGVVYDPAYIVEHADRLTYPVYILPVGHVFDRSQHLSKKLGELAEQARREVVAAQDTGIEAAFDAPLPRPLREAAERLAPVGA